MSFLASAPVFVNNPLWVIATLGKDVSLDCKPRASPKPRILWKRGDRRIQQNKRYQMSSAPPATPHCRGKPSYINIRTIVLALLHTGLLKCALGSLGNSLSPAAQSILAHIWESHVCLCKEIHVIKRLGWARHYWQYASCFLATQKSF